MLKRFTLSTFGYVVRSCFGALPAKVKGESGPSTKYSDYADDASVFVKNAAEIHEVGKEICGYETVAGLVVG